MTPPDVSGMAETVLDGVPDVVAVGDEAVLEGSIFEVNDAINELRVVCRFDSLDLFSQSVKDLRNSLNIHNRVQ